MEFKDYCKIPGVGPDSTRKEIKQAYRKKASGSHPDMHPECEHDYSGFI